MLERTHDQWVTEGGGGGGGEGRNMDERRVQKGAGTVEIDVRDRGISFVDYADGVNKKVGEK